MLVPPDRMSELAELLERIQRGDCITAFETERIRKDGRKVYASLSLSPMWDTSGQIVGISTVSRDITERKRAEEEVARLASFPILNPAPIVEVDLDGRVCFVNPSAQRLFPDLEQRGSDHPWLADAALSVGTGPEDVGAVAREVTVDKRHYHQSLHYVSEIRRIRIYGIDVTERQREQQERETTVGFLRLVNESTDTQNLVRAAATFFQQQSGCQAVGIRLKEGDDYPYFEARGFPQEFLLVENSLCARDSAGGVVRDTVGNPVIECMCGNVICGRFDPSKPFFTAKGSFWTNCTTELLAGSSESDRQGRTRNRCNGEGYESVALIPLSVGGERLGLLQLNDRRQGLFAPETIALWERLADYLAVALAKFRAEEELQKLASVVRHSRELMGVATLDGQMVFINEAGAEMVGLSAEEVKQTHVSQVMPDHLQDKFNNEVMPTLREKGFWEGELQYRNLKTGQLTDVYAITFTVKDAAKGTPLFLANTSLDITRRKRDESNQALMTGILRILNRGGDDLQTVLSEVLRLIRESTGFDAVGLRMRNGDDCPYYEQNGFSDEFLQEENFLCARGLDGAIVRDADGRITLECTCGLVLSGRTDPSMPCFTNNGSFWTNISSELLALAPADDPRTNPRNRCVHAGYQSVGLFPVRSGEEILGLLQLNDRREGRFNPEFIRFFESLADNIGLALRRKHAEEALQKSAEALARSNKDLEQFASVASHDLQEPLRTVSGFVQLLQNKYANQLDAEADTFIKYAVDGTKRMETLIRDLLAYARVTTRSREMVSTDAGAALRLAIGNLEASIQEKGAEIVHGELPTVRADAGQLTQVFQNLIGNALKFRSEAPPKIRVDACREEDYWRFSAHDNGIGIDAKFQDHIFEMFRRLHTRQQYDGSGIGLAICKKIVDRHGGRIWVESEPGQGATFHFTIAI